jgi:hypothetical protein
MYYIIIKHISLLRAHFAFDGPEKSTIKYLLLSTSGDCLCGLVVGVPEYRFRGFVFDSQHCQIFCRVLGLERGPLNLLRITAEVVE